MPRPIGQRPITLFAFRFLFVFALSLAIGGAMAQGHAGHAGHGGAPSPYAGLESREIKSLSETDMEELRRGGGWGLALAAELNGIPGPAHLLELRDAIALSAAQVEAIETIFAAMRAEAIPAGERLIAAEAAIETAFRSGSLDEARLRELIAEAEAARAALRFIHLSRHLSTPPLLSADQIARYGALRGYAPDPCSSVPAGHDAALWRQHNRCP